MQRVCSDPEFLKQLWIVPYDHEAEQEAERQRESQASYVFARKVEREESVRTCRAIVGALVFSVLFSAAFYGAVLFASHRLWVR